MNDFEQIRNNQVAMIDRLDRTIAELSLISSAIGNLTASIEEALIK